MHESWAIAVHEALAGMTGVLVGQLVPRAETYELVITTRESPPPGELVEALRARLAGVVRRDDSPTASWHYYPATDAGTRELFARLDWANAVVLHELGD